MLCRLYRFFVLLSLGGHWVVHIRTREILPSICRLAFLRNIILPDVWPTFSFQLVFQPTPERGQVKKQSVTSRGQHIVAPSFPTQQQIVARQAIHEYAPAPFTVPASRCPLHSRQAKRPTVCFPVANRSLNPPRCSSRSGVHCTSLSNDDERAAPGAKRKEKTKCVQNSIPTYSICVCPLHSPYFNITISSVNCCCRTYESQYLCPNFLSCSFDAQT